ncbi:MAG TPA: type I DNA topoisomerase, partial [Bacillota bacterium]
MAEALIIVESPAKAKTIAKFLGRKYRIAASMGHVRDLPKSQFGVDIDNGFEPKYITIRGKGKILNQLRQEARKAERVLLATDPDREGEAIAWHLTSVLELDPHTPLRIVFHEITKDAVRGGVQQPRPIDFALVDAQQARRVLDRLVGYKLSPFLWSKVRRGLSAGRVQSVAVRLICDREAEIQAFQPEEYWSLTAELARRQGSPDGAERFSAKYYGTPEGKRDLPSEEAMRQLLASLEGATFRVESVTRKERRRHPAPPFTTSTLQQEAARKLGFTVRRTMRAAQQLYEGLEIRGEGTVGLITYMRTDSTRLSDEAMRQAAAVIRERYGPDFVDPKSYARRSVRVQDAHEAIRPTAADRHPDRLKDDLT